jgi:hypothetical protein
MFMNAYQGVKMFFAPAVQKCEDELRTFYHGERSVLFVRRGDECHPQLGRDTFLTVYRVCGCFVCIFNAAQ